MHVKFVDFVYANVQRRISFLPNFALHLNTMLKSKTKRWNSLQIFKKLSCIKFTMLNYYQLCHWEVFKKFKNWTNLFRKVEFTAIFKNQVVLCCTFLYLYPLYHWEDLTSRDEMEPVLRKATLICLLVEQNISKSCE